MKPLVRLLWAPLFGMALALMGCGESGGSVTHGDKLRVVATVAMVGDVVEAVGGESIEVITLMGTSVDPHLHRPTRDDLRELERADIIFYSGFHLEGKMAEVLHDLASRKPSIAVAERTGLGVKADEGTDSYDPHLWMDPTRWKATADVIAQELGRLRPDERTGFEERAQAFEDRCDALASYGRQVMDTVPEHQRVLVTSHDAFRYFRMAFGVRELSLQGLSTESEASLGKINSVVDEVVRLKLPAVFIESSVPPKSVQALIDACRSQGHDVRIGGELFSDAMGQEGTYEGTYIGMIDHNLTTIVRALGGEAPERGLNGKLGPHETR
jgi:manganese/zinc/iron transport system substrate-binding protein